jgi:hypothetical protein
MSTRMWFGLVAVVAALTWAAPVTANAQARQRYPDRTQQSDRSAYDNGYREGIQYGERHARDRRDFNYEREAAYRQAQSGWWGSGDRETYRRAFRQGFAEGYRIGYGRLAWNSSRGGWGSDGRGYPGSGYGSSRGYAFNRGFQEGYEEGADAARDSDRYDPYGEKNYRKGDRGYDKRYGSREYYKQTYREGFRAGYDRGYGEARYSRRGGIWPWR